MEGPLGREKPAPRWQDDWLLPTACCLLATAYCLLPAAYCLLPADYCLLPTACCLLPTAYCLLPAAYRLLLSASWFLPSACSLFPIPYSLLPDFFSPWKNSRQDFDHRASFDGPECHRKEQAHHESSDVGPPSHPATRGGLNRQHLVAHNELDQEPVAKHQDGG